MSKGLKPVLYSDKVGLSCDQWNFCSLSLGLAKATFPNRANLVKVNFWDLLEPNALRLAQINSVKPPKVDSYITGGSRLPNWEFNPPLPSPLPLPFPLEVSPLNTAMGSGSAVSFPSGVWGGAQRKSNLVHFSFKI